VTELARNVHDIIALPVSLVKEFNPVFTHGDSALQNLPHGWEMAPLHHKMETILRGTEKARVLAAETVGAGRPKGKIANGMQPSNRAAEMNNASFCEQ
jgi:hypothetical protein